MWKEVEGEQVGDRETGEGSGGGAKMMAYIL